MLSIVVESNYTVLEKIRFVVITNPSDRGIIFWEASRRPIRVDYKQFLANINHGRQGAIRLFELTA